MIDRDETITFCCDACSESFDTEETDFTYANEKRLALDWLAFKDYKNGEWQHYCPICREKAK